jgi:hypothetical protein
MSAEPRRHIYVPDAQVRAGVPTDHLPWIGQYIADMKPSAVILAGDWYDCPSLSSHNAPGTLTKEGARYLDDIQSGNEALDLMMAPIHAERARLRKGRRKRWEPTLDVTLGNHEQRIQRFVENNPILEGALGYKDFGFTKNQIRVHDFLKPVVIDAIAYCHYWAAPMTGRAYGGSAANILGKLGHSFTQGHRQVFDYATRVCAVTGREQIGLIAGAAYLHAESYLGWQANSHFRGIIVKNEVRDGAYDIMRVSLDYLCRRYEQTSLSTYLKKRYKGRDWSHIA